MMLYWCYKQPKFIFVKAKGEEILMKWKEDIEDLCDPTLIAMQPGWKHSSILSTLSSALSKIEVSVKSWTPITINSSILKGLKQPYQPCWTNFFLRLENLMTVTVNSTESLRWCCKSEKKTQV